MFGEFTKTDLPSSNIMKLILPVLAVVLFSLASCSGDASPEALPFDEALHRTEITELLGQFLAGASRSDAAVHDAFWHENLVYTSSAGLRFGKQQLMAGLDPLPEGAEPAVLYRAEEASVRFYGETAVLNFVLVGEEAGNELRFLNSGVFVREHDRWQAVNWQATRVP